MKQAKLNVELLLAIKAHILAEPRRFIMEWWHKKEYTTGPETPPCNTTACIAGWAILLSPDVSKEQRNAILCELSSDYIPVKAAELLGLPLKPDLVLDEETWQQHPAIKTLFSDLAWPCDLYEDYSAARFMDTDGQGDRIMEKARRIANLGAERIDRYIAEYADKPTTTKGKAK